MAFLVSDLMELTAEAPPYNSEVICENIDDEANGLVIAQDAPLVQFLAGHKDIYNYQIVDASPIRLVRRLVGDDLTVDLEITEDECILRNRAGPRVHYTRVDPMSLPRTIEVQYIDPDRLFAMNAQPATYHGATRSHGKLSISMAFIITNDQARKLGFDLLYRIWGQQLSVSFEHPNPNIEPSDILTLTGVRGEHTLLVREALLTKERTSQIKATVLVTQRAGTIFTTGGSSDGNDFTSGSGGSSGESNDLLTII